jgi:hypothetical protein
MKGSILVAVTVTALTAVLISACSGDNGTTSSQPGWIAQTVPANGDLAYDPNAPVDIAFGAPIDTEWFQERFSCLAAETYDALRDSMDHGMMIGDGPRPFDSDDFYRRMKDRGVNGQFTWNDRRDSCGFMPDAHFTNNTDYVIMMRSMAGRMLEGGHGHMMDHGAGDLILRFRTR